MSSIPKARVGWRLRHTSPRSADSPSQPSERPPEAAGRKNDLLPFLGFLAAGAFSIGALIGSAQHHAPEGRIQGLAKIYQLGYTYDNAQHAFDDLANLSPHDIRKRRTAASRVRLARAIQLNTGLLSSALVAHGRHVGRPTDEYDLAHTIIPRSTQTALKHARIHFTPIYPVNCDAGLNLFHQAPQDYTNHLPADFTVKLRDRGTGTGTVDVPLGAAQQSSLWRVAFTPDAPFRFKVPCDAVPLPEHPPRTPHPNRVW